MDLPLTQLEKRPIRSEVKNYLRRLTPIQIGALTQDLLTQPRKAGNEQVVLGIRGILLGDPNSTVTRLVITSNIIEWLGNELEATNGSGSKVKLALMAIELALQEMEILTPKMLEVTAKQIMDFIDNCIPVQPRIFELLSKLYNLLLVYGSSNTAKAILDSICDAKWNQHSTLGLILCINEMELSIPQLNQVILRIQVQLKELDAEEIPPCICQLLILSKKGCKRAILSTIFEYFDRPYTSKQDIVISRIEGTTMLHITFAISQDQELGTELIKYVSSDRGLNLGMFKMGSLLSAARIHRLEYLIVNFLRRNILSVFKDSDMLERCSWIYGYRKTDIHLIRKYLMDIVDRSASGWDQVIQSVVKLAIVLIDDYTIQPSNNALSTTAGYLNKAALLGIDLLVKMFKLHDGVRSIILEQITTLMVSRSSGTCALLDLLKKLVLDCPCEVAHYKTIIEESLYSLPFLSYTTAKMLLLSIRPLSFTSASFQNGLILVLRKSLFSKELDGRMIAVDELLGLLQDHLTSTHPLNSTFQIGPTSGAAFEILGLLRRCFSQQDQVRTRIYKGFGSLTDYYGAMIADIFGILYAQYKQCFGLSSSMDLPLLLSSCAEDGTKPHVIEPICVLLSNLLKIVRQMKTGEYHFTITSQLEVFQDHIDSLVLTLINMDLEDYGLGKTTNFNTTTSNDLYFFHIADMLLGCLDIVIEHEFMDLGDTFKSCQMVLALFKKRQALLDLLMDSISKDKGRKLSGFRNSSLLGLEFIVKITQALFTPVDTCSPTKILQSDMDFMHYIIAATPAVLGVTLHRNNSWQDGKHFGYCAKLADLYMYMLTHESSDSNLMKHRLKKGKSLLEDLSFGLKCIMETVCTTWPDKYITLLLQLQSVITDTSSSQNTNQAVDNLIDTFKNIVDNYMNANPPLYKESINIMVIIYHHLDWLDPKTDHYTQNLNKVIGWLKRMAQEKSIKDTSVAKEIGAMIIHLCVQVNKLGIIKEIAQDLHNLLGGLESGETVEMNQIIKYGFVNKSTSNAIITLVLSWIEKANIDMLWIIGRLRLSVLSSDSTQNTQHLAFEQEVCAQLVNYVDIISECLDTTMKDPHATRLIKTLKSIYRAFSAIVKYKLVTIKAGMSEDFIALVTRIGSEVTNRMYKFLMMYENLRRIDYNKAIHAKSTQKKQVNVKEKTKILSQSKMIPDLIFAVEQFEQHIIQLTKKSKVDFMQHMKRSTCRDFKINTTTSNSHTDFDLKSDFQSDEPEQDQLSSNSDMSY